MSRFENYLSPAIRTLLFLVPFVVLIKSGGLFFPFITGKALFFRLIIEIAFALWLVLMWRDPSYRPRRSWLLISFIIFIVVLSLATAWSVNPQRSFWSNFERMEGLVTYLHLFAYFIVLATVFRIKDWKIFSGSFLLVNAIVAIYSLLQLGGLITINQGGVRVDATFGNATYLAIYEVFSLFLILVWAVRMWLAGFWKKVSNHRSFGRSIFGFGLLSLWLIDLLILYKTATRGAILGFIVGIIAGAVLVVWHSRSVTNQWTRKLSRAVIGVIVVLLGLFFLLKETNLVTNSSTLSRFASISLGDQTTQSRFLVWNMSWQGFKEHPFLGWGPENYILVFNKYYDPAMYNQEPWFDRSHNVVLDWLISAGGLGLLAYLSLFVCSFYLIWRRGKANDFPLEERALLSGLLLAYFVHNLFVFDNLVSYLLFFGVLAYVSFRSNNSNSLSFSKETKEIKSLKNNLLPITAIAIIVLIISSYKFSVKPWLANLTLIEALKSQAQDHPAEALAHYKKVVAYKTFASTESTEQLISFSAGKVNDPSLPKDLRETIFEFTREEIDSTIAREPYNARYYYMAGTFFFRAGYLSEAKQYLEKARDLSPKKQTILFELGNLYLNENNQETSLKILKDTYELDPNYDEARKIYSLVLVYLGKLDIAEDLLLEKVKDNPSILLDERLVQAYGKINRADKLSSLWQKAVALNPEFKSMVVDFVSLLRGKGVIQ